MPGKFDELHLNRNPDFPHLSALVVELVATPPKLVLVSAPAGFGKSTFVRMFRQLAGTGWHVFDGVPSDLPLGRPEPLLLACRQEEVPAELDRMRLYEDVVEIGPAELVFPESAVSQPIWDRSSGWPLLVHESIWNLPDALFVRYLAREVLSDLPFATLFEAATSEHAPAQVLERIPPLRTPGTSAGKRFGKLLGDAAVAALLKRYERSGLSGVDRDQLWQHPDLMQRLLTLAVQEQQYDLAVTLFEDLGGWFLFYQMGPDPFVDFIRLIPDDVAKKSDEMILANCIHAVKQGEIARCRRLLATHFDPRVLDIQHCLSDECAIPVAVRTFRIVLLVYEETPGNDRLHAGIERFLSHIPLERNLLRGSCNNCLVDHFIRLRRYEEAHEAALRARIAYEKSETPLLSFYIALHLSVLHILRGEINTAETQMALAHKWLDLVPFESAGDRRILVFAQSVLAFEKGDTAPILRFIEMDMEGFEIGEVWPTLAEFMIQFGALALASQYSARVALNFIDHWSHTRVQSRTFRVMSEVRRVRVLQNANRWGEASQALTTIQASIDRVWIESAVSELVRLQSREQIAVALCWLRQIAFEQPSWPYLARQLASMRLNPRLTGRQRLAIDIWSAYVARRAGETSRTKSLLQAVFERIAEQQALSALYEEHLFLQEALSDKRVAAFLAARSSVGAVMKKFEAITNGYSVSSARKLLTRQEFRMLSLLTEGASNKLIARRMDLSEATVKFHLKNLFRKLGCRRRTEAVEAARALGWVA